MEQKNKLSNDWITETRLASLVAVLGLIAVLVDFGFVTKSLAQSAPTTSAATGMRITEAPIFKLDDDAYLRWPLPASMPQYGSIDGWRMKRYVEELVAISDKSRDDGNQFWGRIAGTPYDAQAEQWLADKFRKLGLAEVHFEPLSMPPTWFPTKWQLTASAGGRSVALRSAQPPMRTPGTPPGGLDLEAVYVGLGTPADFMGRDVKGKAVVIYSIPTPSALNHSGAWSGAIKRAAEKGAAAVLIILAIPGNLPAQMYGVGISIPTLTIGTEDGAALRQLIEQGQPVNVKIQLAVEQREGMKTASVWGMLPGTTDENIMVVGHLDAYFEGALDNGSGVATMLGVAEYFAKMPKEKRRRNIYFVSPAAHHEGDLAAKHWLETMQPFFGKTALILCSEHVSVTQSYLFSDQMIKSNLTDAHRYFIGRSKRIGGILVKSAKLFGVGLYANPQPRPLGAIMPLWNVAPALEVIESPAFYHTTSDTPEIVPAVGLEAYARAYANIIDETNRLDLKDIVEPPMPSSR